MDGFRLLLFAISLLTPAIVATDPRGVEEPVIISSSKSGVTHTVTAFIQRVVEEPGVAFRVRDAWVYRNSSGATSSGLLSLPAQYTDSSDPVLAHNGTPSGIAPGRTYLVGRAMNRAAAPDLSTINPTSIRVWMSVNGGASWIGHGAEVDAIASGTRILDKPWIAVSETGPTTGYVYVSWVRVDMTGGGQSELMFRRSRNGISKAHAACCFPPTWDRAVRVTELGRVQGPLIVTDSAGYVYVIFVEFATRQMRIARSRFIGANLPSDGSSVFMPAQTIATYKQVGSGSNANTIASVIRVVPLPAARYNAATNEILVAWTEGESDGSSTADLRLFRVSANAALTAVDVPLSSAINSSGVNQFTPAIETDDAGNVILAYYDSRGLDVSSYQERIAKLSSTGALLSSPISLGSPCAADTVGEYQGLHGNDVAWTCSSSSDRTIMRDTVQ